MWRRLFACLLLGLVAAVGVVRAQVTEPPAGSGWTYCVPAAGDCVMTGADYFEAWESWAYLWDYETCPTGLAANHQLAGPYVFYEGAQQVVDPVCPGDPFREIWYRPLAVAGAASSVQFTFAGPSDAEYVAAILVIAGLGLGLLATIWGARQVVSVLNSGRTGD